MPNSYADLYEAGWCDWFTQYVDRQQADVLARVVSVDRNQFLLWQPSGPIRAKLAGSYPYDRTKPHDLPCVGDWVCVEKASEDDFGLIQQRLQRKTLLRRKSAGDVSTYQIIAANVDYVIIVQSCHFDFNLKRLERYLVMVRDGGAEPLILLSKTDLVDAAELQAQIAAIQAADITVPVFTLSNVTRAGIEELQALLISRKTYCFVGSSGVGKSTLINQLIGSELLETGTVSNSGEGRHTTVRRELVILKSGALVIDNPGMREFGIVDAEVGLESRFADIGELTSQCRYRDCSHSSEPGCAVLAAVESGAISRDHYESYLQLRQESQCNDLSRAEKRQKDRNFGKMIHTAKKQFRKR